MNLRSLILLTLVGSSLLATADDLPQRAPGDTLDFEPKLMLDGPRASAAAASPTPSPEDRLHECQTALMQAEQRAADSEQLFKEGILAKVEIEGRILRVVEARREVADAAVTVAADHRDAVKRSFDANESSQADLAAATAGLEDAQQAAVAATVAWEKAQMDAAMLDLQRKRKLYSEGVGSRREVQMAEDRVALLSGTVSR